MCLCLCPCSVWHETHLYAANSQTHANTAQACTTLHCQKINRRANTAAWTGNKIKRSQTQWHNKHQQHKKLQNTYNLRVWMRCSLYVFSTLTQTHMYTHARTHSACTQTLGWWCFQSIRIGEIELDRLHGWLSGLFAATAAHTQHLCNVFFSLAMFKRTRIHIHENAAHTNTKLYDSSSLCLVSPCIHPIIPLGLLLLFALLLLLLLPLLMSLLFCMWQISNRMFESTFWATSGNSYHTHTITYRCAMCVCMKVEIAPIHRQKTRFCRAPFFGVFYICTHSHTNSTSTEISACLEQMRKVDFYPIWWSNSANFDNHNKYRVCHPF